MKRLIALRYQNIRIIKSVFHRIAIDSDGESDNRESRIRRGRLPGT